MRDKAIIKLSGLIMLAVCLIAIPCLGTGCHQAKEVPQVDFTATPTEGSPPLTVQFTSHSEDDIADWWWFFGDGQSSTGPNPSHAYTAEGFYTVSVVGLRDGEYATVAKDNYIRVGNPKPTPMLLQCVYVDGADVSPRTEMNVGSGHKLYGLDLAGQGILYWTNYKVMDKQKVDWEVTKAYEHSIWTDNIECYGMLDGIYELWHFQQEQTRPASAYYPAIYYKDQETRVDAFWRVNIPFSNSLGFALENNSEYGTIHVLEATLAYGLVVSGKSQQGVLGYGEEWELKNVNPDIPFPVAPKIKMALEEEFGQRVFSVAIFYTVHAYGMGADWITLVVDAPDIPRQQIESFLSQQGFVEFRPTLPR